MVLTLSLKTKKLDGPKPYSNLLWSEKEEMILVKLAMTLFKNAILISEKIYTIASFYLVVLLCIIDCLKDLLKKSKTWLLNQWKKKLKLLLRLKENSRSKLEDQSFHLFLPLNLCGLPILTMNNRVLPLFIENIMRYMSCCSSSFS